jgi:conjugal transfer/entry exclusion protein
MDWKNEIRKSGPDYSVNPSVRMSRMIAQKTETMNNMLRKLGKILEEMDNMAFDNDELQPKISKLYDDFQDLMFDFGSAEDFLSDFMEA